MGESSVTPETWEAIEDLYRAGQISNVEIARRFGISETAIRKRAKRDRWVRDLTEKVRAGVRASLVRDLVRDPSAREAEIVSAGVAAGSTVINTHRQDIRTQRERTSRLGAQLDRLAEHLAGLVLTNENFLATFNVAANVNDALSRALARLIPLERQAFNLDDPPPVIDFGRLNDAQLRRIANGEDPAAAAATP